MNPQPTWTELAPYYNRSYEPYQADHGIEGLEQTIAKAKKERSFRHVSIKPGMSIMDVGCGGGAFLQVARALGTKTQGVEPSEGGYETSTAAGLSVFNGSLDQFIASGDAGQYDLITSNHVVEHHPDPVSLLKDMKKCLKPGGYIWFSVPNAGYSYARELKGLWNNTDLPYHLMQFTGDSARKTIEEAGLTARKFYTHSIPSSIAYAKRLSLRYKFKIPRKITQRFASIEKRAVAEAAALDASCAGEALIIEAT